jgi:hypothetical protein
MVCCHDCGFDLRQALPRKIVFPTWQLAVDLRSLLLFHWFTGSVLIGADNLTAQEVFRDWRLSSGLIRSSIRHSSPIEPEVKSYVDSLPVAKTGGRCPELEVLRINERLALLLFALWLLEDWPNHLNSAKRRADAHSRPIRRGRPDWSRETRPSSVGVI